MSTLHTIRGGALRRWGATALTLAAALIAIGVAVAFIALAPGGQQHVATPGARASTVAPALRHHRTAAAGDVGGAASSTGDCTYVRAEHSCVSGP
jgi:hypothetical protein